MEKEFLLGNDLRTYDSLLDGITFDDLILLLHCNLRKDSIHPGTVKAWLQDLIRKHLEDTWYLVERNMDKIIS